MNDILSTEGTSVPLYENKSFCILLAVAFVLALISSVIFWNTYVVERGGEQSLEGVLEAQPIKQTENDPAIPGEAPLPERVLTGALMFLGTDASFIRISVKDEGIYSVALTPETKITINGTDTDIKSLKPMSPVSVTAFVLPDTEPYDFSAKSVAGGVSPVADATVSSTSVPVTSAETESGSNTISTPSVSTTSQKQSMEEKLKILITESSEQGMFVR